MPKKIYKQPSFNRLSTQVSSSNDDIKLNSKQIQKNIKKKQSAQQDYSNSSSNSDNSAEHSAEETSTESETILSQNISEQSFIADMSSRGISTFDFFRSQIEKTLSVTNPKFKVMEAKEQLNLIQVKWDSLSSSQKNMYTAQAQKLSKQEESNKLKSKQVYDKFQRKQERLRKYNKTKNVDESITYTKRGEQRKQLSPEMLQLKREKNKSDKPKQPLPVYLYFYQENQKQARKQNSSLTSREIAKILGQKWKQISEEEKRPYVEMRLQDVIRYQNEYEIYAQKYGLVSEDDKNAQAYSNKLDIAVEKVIGGKAKTQQAKNQIMPKYFLSAYNYYFKEQNQLMRASYTQVFKELHKNITKTIAGNWKSLDAEFKKPYELISTNDKKRYYTQISDLNKLGYFIKEDGSKSTD